MPCPRPRQRGPCSGTGFTVLPAATLELPTHESNQHLGNYVFVKCLGLRKHSPQVSFNGGAATLEHHSPEQRTGAQAAVGGAGHWQSPRGRTRSLPGAAAGGSEFSPEHLSLKHDATVYRLGGTDPPWASMRKLVSALQCYGEG